jgi:hypothetical protein
MVSAIPFGRCNIMYPDGLDLQLESGVLIDYNHGVGVQLQAGECPHVVDAPFDAFLKRGSFMCSGDDDDNFPSLTKSEIYQETGEKTSPPKQFVSQPSKPFSGLA